MNIHISVWGIQQFGPILFLTKTTLAAVLANDLCCEFLGQDHIEVNLLNCELDH